MGGTTGGRSHDTLVIHSPDLYLRRHRPDSVSVVGHAVHRRYAGSHADFIAILFTSGLDVGLIMFPLTEFGGYGNVSENPEYAFANPLAIEFGFWAFLIWGFYFLTCFYFAIIEPRVKFFEIPMVKLVNNVVIIGTCAFTAYLLLVNLPWYLPQLGDGESVVPAFYLIVFLSIALAVYSSSKVKYIRF